MNIEDHLKAVLAHGDYRIQRKVKMVDAMSEDPIDNPIKILVVDTETTGSTDSDVVIENAGILVEACRDTGRIGRILDVAQGLEDTDVPISEGAFKVHGISKEMLAGQKIDRAHFVSLYNQADLVVAHNSAFDRPKIEHFFQGDGLPLDKPWGCTYKNIGWFDRGYPKSGLEYLVALHGFFHGAHRATDDVLALIYCLSVAHPEKGYPLMDLMPSVVEPEYMIKTLGTFDFKEQLKTRGYFYTGDDKSWSVIVQPIEGLNMQESVKNEVRVLRDEVLKDAYGAPKGRVFFGKKPAGRKFTDSEYEFTELNLATANV